jgi:hypothetical protein
MIENNGQSRYLPGGHSKQRGTRRHRPAARLDFSRHAKAMQFGLVQHHPNHATLPEALKTAQRKGEISIRL